MTYELRMVTSNEDWEAYHSIRERVLWEARGRADSYDRFYPDEHKAGHFPFLLIYEDEPVGAVRVDLEPPVAWFRRVAVRENVQRHGHGQKMLELAAEFAKTRGCQHVRSNVDPAAAAFYRRLGFENITGEHRGPSVPMERRL
jgi:GNAT superfamily N-acetyltransferase